MNKSNHGQEQEIIEDSSNNGKKYDQLKKTILFSLKSAFQQKYNL